MVYQWKSVSRVCVDANVAGAVCEQLADKGCLSAKNLLDASRPEEAPLHHCFEWDDSVAAEMYREDQARYIIRSLVIVPEKKEPVRGFFRIENAGNTYHTIQTILQSDDATAKLFNTAMNELKALHRKYAALQRLERVWNAVEECEKENERSTA